MSLNNKLIYSRAISGKALRWRAFTDYSLNEDGHITITIEFGQVDGKLQLKHRYVKSGKNLGRSNATTIREQADLEIKYLYQKQYDKSYFDSLDDFEVPLRPQLAHKYVDKAHKINWVQKTLDAAKAKLSTYYYASKKLNGIRCFIFVEEGRVVKFESRTGKEFKYFTHISQDLNAYRADDESVKGSKLILDGELFNPVIPFEILCSLINSDEYVEVKDSETGKVWSTNDVQFHCYDFINLNKKDQNFVDRFVNAAHIPNTDNIKLVESISVHSEDEMIALAKAWIREGFEGLMLRAGFGVYEFGQRSSNLLKFKIMDQAEFLIDRIYLAENDPTKVMFTLFNHFATEEEHSKFDCALKGDKLINLEIYKNRATHEKESWLTTDFQVLSKYNVPLFPVGIIIRKGRLVNGVFTPDT